MVATETSLVLRSFSRSPGPVVVVVPCSYICRRLLLDTPGAPLVAQAGVLCQPCRAQALRGPASWEATKAHDIAAEGEMTINRS